jgi:hypothetical protein
MYKKITKTKTIKEMSTSPIEDVEDYEVPEGIDIILVDVPLMIRLLEYAREEATSDVDLHKVATRLITKSNKWKSWKPLTMQDYEQIVPAIEPTVVEPTVVEPTSE